jgi:hypothetical protein
MLINSPFLNTQEIRSSFRLFYSHEIIFAGPGHQEIKMDGWRQKARRKKNSVHLKK